MSSNQFRIVGFSWHYSWFNVNGMALRDVPRVGERDEEGSPESGDDGSTHIDNQNSGSDLTPLEYTFFDTIRPTSNLHDNEKTLWVKNN